MFGWRSKESQLEESRLRQAFRKRLSEVLGLPVEGFDRGEVSQQARFETALETHTEPELTHTCQHPRTGPAGQSAT